MTEPEKPGEKHYFLSDFLPFSKAGNLLWFAICFLAGCLAWRWALG
jgi:hypothetical protein